MLIYIRTCANYISTLIEIETSELIKELSNAWILIRELSSRMHFVGSIRSDPKIVLQES